MRAMRAEPFDVIPLEVGTLFGDEEEDAPPQET